MRWPVLTVLASLTLPMSWLMAQQVPFQLRPIDVERAVRRQNQTPFVPLAMPVKLNLVRELLKPKVPPQTLQSLDLSSPISLTVANSVIPDKAFLGFFLPEYVAPYENSATLAGNAAQLQVFLNALSPGWYVFDFYIDAYQEMNLKFIKFAADGDAQERLVKPGKGQHQLFASQVTKPGWYVFQLSQDKGVWNFYRVEISQVK